MNVNYVLINKFIKNSGHDLYAFFVFENVDTMGNTDTTCGDKDTR